MQVICLAECPDWEALARNSNTTLEIDCGGWPLPELVEDSCVKDEEGNAVKGFDPCGCPLPRFMCRKGTQGSCDGFKCPAWGKPPSIDCKSGLPPVVNTINAKHVCACEWPPAPTCATGTGPPAVCDSASEKILAVEVDCKGRPLEDNKGLSPESPEWRFKYNGGCRNRPLPKAAKCRGETHCPAVNKCKCPDTSDRGALGAIGPFGECPPPTLTSIDCNGDKIVAEPPKDCPPCDCVTEIFVCLECTECCLGNLTKCGRYACGLGRDIAPVPTDTCRITCSKDQHCADGFQCEHASGECNPIGALPQPLGGCRGDMSEPCEPYSCNNVANSCMQDCFSDLHCSTGYTCQFSSLT
eukprot:gene5831-788_t